MLTEKMEEYLEALFKLSCEEEPITPTRVAEYLGVTSPSVLDMIHRLEGEGAGSLLRLGQRAREG